MEKIVVKNGKNNIPMGTLSVSDLPKSWQETIRQGNHLYLSIYPGNKDLPGLRAWSPAWKNHRSIKNIPDLARRPHDPR